MMKVKETIISLIAGIDGFSGVSYKVHVDFFAINLQSLNGEIKKISSPLLTVNENQLVALKISKKKSI
ncbi:hypothetical protein QFZ31_006245 [Neobacillus niacini]|uniref:hypothetical protein n=1 Tax=Neobacillus driksii TaxID=3035913 RepID=UPI00278A228B|nr:hypothetical protein [Neobacillus niacini]MDQ0976367.1 hypothetical protein [Neobacillus niacini]